VNLLVCGDCVPCGDANLQAISRNHLLDAFHNRREMTNIIVIIDARLKIYLNGAKECFKEQKPSSTFPCMVLLLQPNKLLAAIKLLLRNKAS